MADKPDFEMTEIEQDVRAEDLAVLFKGGAESPLPDLVRRFGPGPIIALARHYKAKGERGGRIWIQDYDELLRAARDRAFARSGGISTPLPTE